MGFTPSSSNTVIFTVIDHFSKFHFISLPKLPQVVIGNVFRIYGLLSDVVSDRGPQIVFNCWREFCRQIGATDSLSSGFHPQSNGQAVYCSHIYAES